MSVALVPPKKNVFLESVEHLLVLATPVEVILLAVSFNGILPSGDINILPSRLVNFIHFLQPV